MRMRKHKTVVVALCAMFAANSSIAAPPNDDFSNRTDLGSALPVTNSSTFDDSDDESIWWEWTAPSSGWYRFHLEGTPFGYLNLYIGSSEATLRRLGTSECGGPDIDMDVYCENGQTLIIEALGDCNGEEGGDAELSISQVADPLFSLRDVSISPSSVDITSAARQIEVTFRLVGTAAVNPAFPDFPAFIGHVYAAGNFVEVSSTHRIAGNRNDGTYRVNLEIQRFLKPGEYDVHLELFSEDFASLGDGGGFGTRPPAGDLFVNVINSGPADCDPPVLVDMQIDPDMVDLSDGPATVSVSVSVTDDLFGVTDGWITLYDEQGDWVANGWLDTATLTSGTPTNGTYELDVEIPDGIPAQTLTIDDVVLIDGIGHESYFGPFETPFPAGVETEIAVDYSRPTLNITANGGTVTVVPDKAEYTPGESVTLTANPDAGNLFAGWDGHAAGSQNPLTITMDSSKWITANFGKPLPGSAVEDGSMTWITGGDAFWSVQSGMSQTGGSAFQSGDIDDVEGGQSTFVETSVTGPGTLTFWWKVSSEGGWDYLKFLVDGELEDEISGDLDWEGVSVEIHGAGPHQLRWSYEKDGSISENLDTAWLDNVQWSPSSGGSSYADFAAANGLPADPARAIEDNNGNGHPDVFDYALDLSDETAPATLIGAVPPAPGTTPGMSFTLPSPARPDVILEAQASPNPAGGWQTIATKDGAGNWTGGATVTEVSNGDGTVTVTIRETSAMVGDECFLRLRASLR